MSKTKTTGIGVDGLLGVAFVVLKLTGVINWCCAKWTDTDCWGRDATQRSNATGERPETCAEDA